MSATPESFIDTIDADVEVQNEPVSPGIDSKPVENKVAPDASDTTIKDKIEPAKNDAVEKVVPLKALQEEREQAKELKKQIAELQAQPKLSAEDAELLKDLKAQRAIQQAPKAVDFMEDPKGYVDAIDKKAQAALDKLKETTESTNRQFTAQQQFQALQNAVVTSEQAFLATTPDYYNALGHIRAVRTAQIKLMDSSLSDQQISQALAGEEMRAAAEILKRGGNPCDFAYQYAKTLGYTKKAAPNGQAGEQKLAPDKSAVRTMGAGGGDAPTDDVMDDDDPNAEFKSLKASFKRR